MRLPSSKTRPGIADNNKLMNRPEKQNCISIIDISMKNIGPPQYDAAVHGWRRQLDEAQACLGCVWRF